MRWFSDSLYWFLHFCSRWMLRIHYPGLQVDNLEYARIDGPFILSTNHPNTLIDPLITGIFLKERLHFMAHAGLFQNKLLASFLGWAGVVPISRAKDRAAGMRVDNQATFDQVIQLLCQGDNLFMAPEGGSELERRLRPLKSGLARIAFQAEVAKDWQLGLKILPAVVQYESPTSCMSRAYIRYSRPIALGDWKAAYLANPTRAVRELTEAVADHMRAMMIDTRDKQEERVLRPIERAIQHDQPLPVDAHHSRTQSLLEQLRKLPDEEYEQLSQQARHYENELQKAKLTDLSLSQHPRKGLSAGLILGFPLFLYGFLNHLLWWFIVSSLPRWTGIMNNYWATIRGLSGVVLLPIFYGLQAWVVGSVFGGIVGWLYLLTLPVAGLFALEYAHSYRPYFASLHAGRASEELLAAREAMLSKLGAYSA